MTYLLSAIAGLIFGSFANVCIRRLPADESIASPGSRCPECKAPIRTLDNIPVISYFLLHGRCRKCGWRIPIEYPLVEVGVALLFLLNAWYFQPSPGVTVMMDVLAFYVLAISVIDDHHRIIPDELSLSLAGLGVAVAWWNPLLPKAGMGGLIESLGAGLLGCLGMLVLAWAGEKVFHKEALGGGDIKLVAAFGAFFGWNGLFGSLMVGSILGGVAAIILMAAGKKKRGETLPFGPFLCIGAYLTCFFPSNWLHVLFP